MIKFIPTRNPYVVTDKENKTFLLMHHNVLCQFLRNKNILTDENKDDAYKDFEEFLKKVRAFYGIPVIRFDTFVDNNMFIESFEFRCGDQCFNSISECVAFARSSGMTKSNNDTYVGNMILKAVKNKNQLYGKVWSSKVNYIDNLKEYQMKFVEKFD